uniref:Uncharacterized protein n=1 Tax=Anguilla anguilla TaxID=7936 RepID=A0A0E9V5V1_ANGAN
MLAHRLQLYLFGDHSYILFKWRDNTVVQSSLKINAYI